MEIISLFNTIDGGRRRRRRRRKHRRSSETETENEKVPSSHSVLSRGSLLKGKLAKLQDNLEADIETLKIKINYNMKSITSLQDRILNEFNQMKDLINQNNDNLNESVKNLNSKINNISVSSNDSRNKNKKDLLDEINKSESDIIMPLMEELGNIKNQNTKLNSSIKKIETFMEETKSESDKNIDLIKDSITSL